MRSISSIVLLALFLVAALAADEAGSEPKNKVDAQHAKDMAAGLDLFKRDVRQIFAGRCLKCHGGEDTEGDFSLASREALLKGGASGKAVDPQKSQSSLLLKLIRHEDEPVMPEDGAKLDQRQIDAIAKWIELGAPYDKPFVTTEPEDASAWTRRTIDHSARSFWSLQPLADINPEFGDDAWARTTIDDFVLQKLGEAGLTPASVASRRALMRRAYFDLIGLPPTAAEAEAFLSDNDPDAYEKLIDHLLSNKHHGERVARHWLDIARFAESHGFEQDYDRPHAYHYRDFVIKAFNQDMPFDRFIRLQIAGDEIDPADPLAMMATGFLGAGVFPTQLTEKEFESSRYDELDDMVATLGTAMLGMTIGCARCHDHKFDPIPSRDYYQLVSAFRTAIRSNVEIELDPESTRKAAAQWKRDLAPLEKALADFEANELPGRFDQFLNSMGERPAAPDRHDGAPWITLAATSIRSEKGANFQTMDDGSYLATGTNANFDTYVFETETSVSNITALRLEALADDSMTKRGPGRAGNGNFGLSKIIVTAQPLDRSQKPSEVKLLEPVVSFQQNSGNLSISGSLDDDPKTGWAVDPKFGQDHAASFLFAKPVGFAGGARLTVKLEFNVNTKHNIGRVRLAVSSNNERPGLDAKSTSQADSEFQQLQRAGNQELSNAQRETFLSVYKKTDQKWRSLHEPLQKHLAAKPKPTMATVMVTSEGVKPIPNHGDGRGFPHFYQDVFFLNRGDVNQKRGVATEGFLQALTRTDKPDAWKRSPPNDATTSFRRSTVARWLTDTEQGAGHLLARVIVNRLWQQHFGRGIVSTPNDFGFQGERPTHPELLDWLAAELIRNDWRLKPIRKMIMTSSVYMQDSTFDEAKSRIDPDNRLLWRFSPRRLEAEIIRDSMLSVGGQLDTKQLGPGTLDDNMRRRSIYFFIKRSKLIPFLQVFDAPEPLASVGSRPSTTIAPQALIFMNNPRIRDYAKSFAKKVESDQVDSSIRLAYMTAIARQPTDSELNDSLSFINQQIESYQSDSKPDARHLAMTDFCQVLMGLSEFIYVD